MNDRSEAAGSDPRSKVGPTATRDVGMAITNAMDIAGMRAFDMSVSCEDSRVPLMSAMRSPLAVRPVPVSP